MPTFQLVNRATGTVLRTFASNSLRSANMTVERNAAWGDGTDPALLAIVCVARD